MKIYLLNLVKTVSEIDVYKSAAKMAIRNGYVKPEIKLINDENEKPISYIQSKAIRHPIIERIQKDIQYVPNDIVLGHPEKKLDGMLLWCKCWW